MRIDVQALFARRPAVCAPLVGRTRDALLAEAAQVAARSPDIVEWRVDFFEGIGRTDDVVALAAELARVVGDIPLLFTRRSQREGGEPVAVSDEAVAALCDAVCRSGHVHLLDVELASQYFPMLRATCSEVGVGVIVSSHDFQSTPPRDEIERELALMEDIGADVAKIAVMPRDMQDVLTLLQATLDASTQLRIPVVTMAMGPLGAVTRLSGFAFGSAMTFAVGAESSAPGQMPIDDVRAGVEILRRAMDDRGR